MSSGEEVSLRSSEVCKGGYWGGVWWWVERDWRWCGVVERVQRF